MTERRQYRLLCPIARALDVLGDRWTLLILRDLHAGPARYQELQEGLGIATNLLSTRLGELTGWGMIERSPDGYRLTEAGRRTDLVLWELARFGTGIDRDDDPRPPGNLRTLVLPLRMMLQAVPDPPDLRAELMVDDAVLTIVSGSGTVDVQWGRSGDPVDIAVRTNYQAFLDVGEGLLPIGEFVAHHLDIVDGHEHGPALLALLTPVAGEPG